MNISPLKKLGALIISLCLLSPFAVAQQNSSTSSGKQPAPTGAAILPSIPPIVYPNTTWPYGNLQAAGYILPTLDMSSTYYLPYLPWIGQNLALLANYADFFYQQKWNDINGATGAVDAAGTTAANSTLNQVLDSNAQKVSAQTTQALQTQLSFVPNSQLGTLVGIPGTDLAIPCQGDKCPPLPSDVQFNADTLLGNIAYQNNPSDINALITFLANLTQSFPNPGLSNDATTRTNQLKNSSAMQKYILAVRSTAALQSMALSNFNFLAQERAVIPNLGTEAGIVTSGKPQADASQMEVEKYLIDKRLNNPNWYTAINNASPVAIQRETLYVLVEMQRQLYQLRLLNERMLATLSTMQMAMTQLNRSSLEVQATNLNQANSSTSASNSSS